MISKEQYFYFADGDSTKNLQELKDKIELLSYEEFYAHVNQDKNDFANWTQHVLKKDLLAEKLRKVTSIVETIELLNEELNPEKIKVDSEKLADKDFQKMIEDSLFGDLEEPKENPSRGISEEANQELKKDSLIETNDSMVTKDDLQKMTDNIEFPKEIKAGTPVLKKDKAQIHKPITETADAALVKENQDMKKYFHSFLVKETLWGLLLGLIIGFFLGRLISLFI